MRAILYCYSQPGPVTSYSPIRLRYIRRDNKPSEKAGNMEILRIIVDAFCALLRCSLGRVQLGLVLRSLGEGGSLAARLAKHKLHPR